MPIRRSFQNSVSMTFFSTTKKNRAWIPVGLLSISPVELVLFQTRWFSCAPTVGGQWNFKMSATYIAAGLQWKNVRIA